MKSKTATTAEIPDNIIESLRGNVIPYHFLDSHHQRAITLISRSGFFPVQLVCLNQETLKWVSPAEMFPPGSGYATQRFVIFRVVDDE